MPGFEPASGPILACRVPGLRVHGAGAWASRSIEGDCRMTRWPVRSLALVAGLGILLATSPVLAQVQPAERLGQRPFGDPGKQRRDGDRDHEPERVCGFEPTPRGRRRNGAERQQHAHVDRRAVWRRGDVTDRFERRSQPAGARRSLLPARQPDPVRSSAARRHLRRQRWHEHVRDPRRLGFLHRRRSDEPGHLVRREQLRVHDGHVRRPGRLPRGRPRCIRRGQRGNAGHDDTARGSAGIQPVAAHYNRRAHQLHRRDRCARR